MIEVIASKIIRRTAERQTIANTIRERGIHGQSWHILQPQPYSGTVCGVDGGIVDFSLQENKLILVKSSAVCQTLENSKIKSSMHYPMHAEPKLIHTDDPLDIHEQQLFKTYVRLESEIGIAREVAEIQKPDVLLLDGSIIMLPSDVADKSSNVYDYYLKIKQKFEDLYEFCLNNQILLGGAVKDSHSRRLAEILNVKMNDSVLTYYVLQQNERTPFIPIDEETNNIYISYLKLSKYDRPLRVELLTNNIEADSSVFLDAIMATVIPHREYTFPAPLIEADHRAHLTDKEIKFYYSRLLGRLGRNPELFMLRRNNRPFR